MIQVEELTSQSFEGQIKITPQLREMVAWIMGFSESFINFALEKDPSIFFLCDPTTINDTYREQTLLSILDLIEKDQLFPGFDYSSHKFHKLNFQGIRTLLHDFIIDKGKKIITRIAAIEIALSCDVNSLDSDLLSIALDQSETINLRKNAAYALQKNGSHDSKEKLLPLAFGNSGDDPDDELKGIGLFAIWPEIIDTKTLFSLLTPAKSENIFGTYKSFFSKISNELTGINLIEALNWAKDLSKYEQIPTDQELLIDNLLIETWTIKDDPHLLNLLAEIIYLRIRNCKNVIIENSYINPSKIKRFQESLKKITTNAILLLVQ